jgi:hypothetical protein
MLAYVPKLTKNCQFPDHGELSTAINLRLKEEAGMYQYFMAFSKDKSALDEWKSPLKV